MLEAGVKRGKMNANRSGGYVLILRLKTRRSSLLSQSLISVVTISFPGLLLSVPSCGKVLGTKLSVVISYLQTLFCNISHFICFGTVRHDAAYLTNAAASISPNPKTLLTAKQNSNLSFNYEHMKA